MTKKNYTKEQRETFISQLKEIVAKGKYWHTTFTNDERTPHPQYTELRQFIDDETPLLSDKKYTINTKVYWILNGITDFPRCQNPECNKPMKKNIRVQFDGHKGYAKFCSCRCASSDEEVQAKYKATCEERYGYDNGSKVPEVIEKIKQIQFERNGGLWDFQTERFREQTKNWCMRNYDVENYVQTNEYRQKYIHTMMEKHGVEHYSQTDEFKQKYLETIMQRYGGFPTQVEECRNKLMNTNMEKYGVKWITELINSGAYGHPNRSKPENEVFMFVKNILNDKIDVVQNDHSQMTPNNRNGWSMNHELDIWIPSLNVAIEFQGSFWHNPLLFPKTAYNDKEKQIQCEEKGIILIQVNEKDWKNNKELVEQKLERIIYEKRSEQGF